MHRLILQKIVSKYQRKLHQIYEIFPNCKIGLFYDNETYLVNLEISKKNKELIHDSLNELLRNAIESIFGIRYQSFKHALEDENIRKKLEVLVINDKFEAPLEGIVSAEIAYFPETILISIEDNGIGLPKGFEYLPYEQWESYNKYAILPKPGGYGVRLANRNILKLGGSMKHSRRKDIETGTKVEIKIPYSNDNP